MIPAGGGGRPHTVHAGGIRNRRQPEEAEMSKGMNQKKDQKKKPAKTMKEKKAEKRDKKATKAFAPV